MKNELQPSRNGAANELEQALNAPKVCNASSKELEAILRRCFILVGLRAANLPSPEETNILTAFIFKKFGLLTLQEIQIAFEKAVAGELEIDSASCYENFSCEYFGKIISAYKKWASQKFNENQMYVVKPMQTNLLAQEADWKGLCEAYYQDYLSGKFIFNIMPYQLYDEFVRCNMMAADTCEDFLSDAKKMLIKQLKIDLVEAGSDHEKTELQERLREIEANKNELKIIQQAKKLAVKFLYKTAKEKGFKNLFVKR